MTREEALHHIKHSFVYGEYELPTLDRERILEALEQEPTTKNDCAEQNGCISCSLDDGDDCCRKLYEESMQDLVTENTSESNSNEMIAAHILESINEGFNKERLLHSWFGDNRRRDIAFKRAILALRAIDNIGNNMEEYYFSCLDLRSVTPQESFINKSCVSENICEHDKNVVLDNIRAEIKGMYRVILKGTPKDDWAVRWNDCLDEVLEILDKYKAERSVEDE